MVKECVICYDEMNRKNVINLSCKHSFHKKCIVTLIKKRKLSPLYMLVTMEILQILDNASTNQTLLSNMKKQEQTKLFRHGGVVSLVPL
mgnify:CR=1 FL=1